MEIIGDDKSVEQNKPQAEDEGKLFQAFKKARDQMAEEAAAAEASRHVEKPDDVVAEASTDDEAKADPVVAAGTATDGALRDAAATLGGPSQNDVKVLRRHKEAFLDCVVNGSRYTEEFRLYGGRLVIRVRCRSAAETEAIEAYARRKVSSGETRYQSEYMALMRRLLLTAQLAEANGVEYPEMAAPYKFVETADGLTPPAWESQMKVWDSKSDAWMSAVAGAILEFEARYWKMVSMSGDENFWAPGESTGE